MQENQSNLVAHFWALPDDAFVDEVVTGAVIKKSKSWLGKQRAAGTGIPYTCIGRDFFYKKRDVVQNLESNRSDAVEQGG